MSTIYIINTHNHYQHTLAINHATNLGYDTNSLGASVGYTSIMILIDGGWNEEPHYINIQLDTFLSLEPSNKGARYE